MPKANVRITRYGDMAVIAADYTFTVNHETRRGVDLLTVCRDGHGWRIFNLTYEQTECLAR